jgi:hypothetical protein
VNNEVSGIGISGSYGLSIHDNTIHDCQLDGIVMTTVDPSRGPVQIYNNLIYNAGKGPDPAELGSGAWSCLYVRGSANVKGESGVIDVFNNTFYACGTYKTPGAGRSSGGLIWIADGNPKSLNLRNNILYLTTGPADLPYLNGDQATITGSNNLFFGLGPLPSGTQLTNTINADPLFVAPGSNFQLNAGSPAIDAGVATPALRDLNGNPRQGAGFDMGVFEKKP